MCQEEPRHDGATAEKQPPAASLGRVRTRLHDLVHRLKVKHGAVKILGRYHTEPRRLEQDYELSQKVLGDGVSGKVLLATGKGERTARKYAVKSYDLLKADVDQSTLSSMEVELEILLTVDHPHVVRLADAYETTDRLHLVMDCIEFGEVFERLLRQRRFSEEEAALTLRQTLLAVSYLHSQGIVHRDLKPENLMYDSQDGTHLRLIDFGLSALWKPGNAPLQRACGTLSYTAPEVLAGSYSTTCDLWSIGVVAFMLLTGFEPFAGTARQLMESIQRGRTRSLPDTWKRLSSPASHFVHRLLTVSPAARLSAKAALEHPWLMKYARPKQPVLYRSVALGLQSLRGGLSRLQGSSLLMLTLALDSREVLDIGSVFLEMDTSRTGILSVEDLRRGLEGVVDTQVDSDWEDTLRALRVAVGDGTGCLAYSQFLAAVMLATVAPHDALMRDAFNHFDQRKSGHITEEVLREVVEGTGRVGRDKPALGLSGNHVGPMSLCDFQELVVSTYAAATPLPQEQSTVQPQEKAALVERWRSGDKNVVATKEKSRGAKRLSSMWGAMLGASWPGCMYDDVQLLLM